MFEKYTKKEIIEARKITNDDVTLYRMITELLNTDTSAIPLFNVGDYLCRSIENPTTWIETKEDFEANYSNANISEMSRGMQPKTPPDFFSKTKGRILDEFLEEQGKRILDGYLAYVDPVENVSGTKWYDVMINKQRENSINKTK